MRKLLNQATQRRLLTAILIMLTGTSLQAQVPNPYPEGTLVNYIRTWDATAPEKNGNHLSERQVKDVKMVTQYFDGIGRPLQTVVKQGSLETNPANPQSAATAVDMVSPVLYDAFGREEKKYLSFASTATDITKANGSFKMNPFQQQSDFMIAQYGPQGETFFYGKTNFEASPLSRIEKQMAPGDSWTGNSKGVEMKYWVNTITDAVRVWNVTENAGTFASYRTTSTYNPGELFKNVTKDEHGKQVIEFKDKEGKLILKKVQLTAVADDGSGRDYTGWLCTYYIYDDLDNLRGVIQPEGVNTLAASLFANCNPISNTVLLYDQCFQYEYDARGRMTQKKVPGAGEVYMVYDGRDRVIMTQDANMRASSPQKWMVTKYDYLNRPSETGLWNNDGNSFAIHTQNAASNITGYPSTTSGYEELTKTFYDDYSWLGTNGNPFPSFNYNTNYNNHFEPASNQNWPYAQNNEQSFLLNGMATGSKVKVLGTSTYLYTISFYDEKGRVIQTQSTNITGGTDIQTTQYTWAGQPLVMVLKQQKSGAVNPQEHIVITKMEYDELGRLLNVKKAVNSTINSVSINKAEQLIAKHEYDKLGQLKKKILGASNLETLNYDYNIRGWMLGMNRDYLTDAGTANYFGFELGYDKLTNKANRNFFAGANNGELNGNINGMIWKSKGDQVRRKYDFEYDAANRLLKGDFEQNDNPGSWGFATMNYKMQMGDGADPTSAYDANGNIKAMTQYGWRLGISTSTPIDNMKYTYIDGTNRLKSVTDFNNDPLTKLGDFKTNTTHPDYTTKTTLTPGSTPAQFNAITDYSYDANGNLTTDNNKEIVSIEYNHLNLPQTITLLPPPNSNFGSRSINYIYDAAGNKLKKEVNESSGLGANKYVATTYVGGFVYETKTTNAGGTYEPAENYQDKFQFTGHEEGRTRALYDNPTDPHLVTGFAHDYMLKDHLGNVRTVLTEEQKQDIYPAATLENATHNGGTAIDKEGAFYTINTPNVVSKTEAVDIPVYQNNNGNPPYNNNPYSNATANSDWVYKLNATTNTNTNSNKTGLGIALKVMAGDNINIYGKSYHKKPLGGSYTNPVNNVALTELISAFLNSGPVASHGISAAQVTGQAGFPTSVNDLIDNPPAQNGNRPRASINWIIFDEQFKYVDGGFDMVGSDDNGTGILKTHDITSIPTIPIPKNGYLYVYCSNESQYNVFFDNLQVIHTRGPILEETHYYPFGLELAGISSKALAFGNPENKLKYNGIEKENSFEIGIYDAQLRELDGQTGRWWQIDPKTESMEMWSPYTSNYNNPILYTDPKGDEPECCGGFFGDIVDGFVDKTKGAWHAITHPRETINNALSVEGLKSNFINTISFGTYNDAKTLFNEGPGKFIGGKAFDVAATVATDGIVKSLPLGNSKNLVYRALAEGENPKAGLSARNPDANNTPISHVAGKKDSQWISSTKDKSTAMGKYNSGNGVVAINLSKVGATTVVDLSNGIPGKKGMFSNWAKKDKEVLIKGYVPAKAIKTIAAKIGSSIK